MELEKQAVLPAEVNLKKLQTQKIYHSPSNLVSSLFPKTWKMSTTWLSWRNVSYILTNAIKRTQEHFQLNILLLREMVTSDNRNLEKRRCEFSMKKFVWSFVSTWYLATWVYIWGVWGKQGERGSSKKSRVQKWENALSMLWQSQVGKR